AVDAAANHLREGVLDEFGVAGVVEGVGEGQGEPGAIVELAEGEQPGVAGELTCRQLDHERRAEEVKDVGPGGCYRHRLVAKPVLRLGDSRFGFTRRSRIATLVPGAGRRCSTGRLTWPHTRRACGLSSMTSGSQPVVESYPARFWQRFP